MQYFYYPGCSLKATGKAYEESLLAVFGKLGLKLQELPDWNCCGATTYMGVDEVQAFALAARNLALAEKLSDAWPVTLIAPCNACYLVLNKAQRYIAEYKAVKQRVCSALYEIDLTYCGEVQVRHPLDVLINDIGLDAVHKSVSRPLEGMKAACYYGCQIVRPYATFDNQYNPTSMDKILRVLGAKTVEWPLKTRCCGASLTGTVQSAGLHLSYILLKEARRSGADTVSTCCPLCQHNLECYQPEIRKLYGEGAQAPVLYFTQLMGLALGIPGKALGLQRLMIPIHLAAAAV
jgi:heterodisulfide reductase subunit B